MIDLFVNVFLSIPLMGAFAMFALGISVIYRASRVLNLAHGAMAMVPAYIFHTLIGAGVPKLIGLPLAVASGAVLGVGVERLFVRRLRPQGPTAQTVGTVAVAGLLIALAAKVWGTTPIIAPTVFPDGALSIAGAKLRYGDIGLFAVGFVVSVGLFAFFKYTEIGLAMRGAAQNRRAASLMGIDPDVAAAGAWALGGGLAALAGVLLAAVTNLDPYNLSLQVLPAFVAALIGGLESLLGALFGAVIAGLAFGLVPTLAKLPLVGSVLRYSGAPQLVLTILALFVMATRGRRLSTAETESGLLGGAGFRRFKPKRLGPMSAIVGVGLFLLPWTVPFSVLGDALLAIELALVALSLVVLTGWVGQISLGQASFVGLGALVTAIVVRGWGWGFPADLIVGALVGALSATFLGMVALRVRGLYLAVATLIFAWMADQFLFRSPWLGASGGASSIPNRRIGTEGGLVSLDMTSRTVLYFIFLTLLVIAVVSLANLRDTKMGRAFFAVRGSEVAAASLGIDVVKTKLVAFAISGLLAGLGGALLLVEQRTVVPAQFIFTVSLQYLAMAVVGGLGSIGGAIAAGVLFAGLNELFFQVRALAGWLEVVSAGLLAAVLLLYPGGLAAVPEAVSTLRAKVSEIGRRRLKAEASSPDQEASTEESVSLPESQDARGMGRRGFADKLGLTGLTERVTRSREEPGTSGMKDWLEHARDTGLISPRVPHPLEAAGDLAPSTNGKSESHTMLDLSELASRPILLPPDRTEREPLIEAEGVEVRFGGLTAVDGATMTVRAGEIVGLIGPNGAGKTTLFNAILGLNDPTAGRVFLHGVDVTSHAPHERARLGIARTFQVIQLFNELSVFDNLLVATHIHNESHLVSNITGSALTLQAETDARRRVREIIRLLQLDHVADEGVRNLPFGILRMVELGRALVTGAPLIMLDEPASGLNEQETDRLMEVVRAIRALGVTVLLIEHDVRMVTAVSDYVYVLDRGAMIAEGEPQDVVRDDRVIAAYLGGTPEDAAMAGSV